MTVGDCVTQAMQLLQVLPAGQGPSPDEMSVGLDYLNQMLANWNSSLAKALAGSYASSIFTFQPLSTYASSTDAILTDAGWQRAYKYNLAVELGPVFGRQIPPEVATIAQQSKMALITLQMPPI